MPGQITIDISEYQEIEKKAKESERLREALEKSYKVAINGYCRAESRFTGEGETCGLICKIAGRALGYDE